MFSFLRRSAPKSPTAAVCRALEEGGLPSSVTSASMLRVVESRGRYSNRKVTYIRGFAPVRAAERSLDVRGYKDLDAYQDLVLRSGHIEGDGVVMSRRPSDGDAPGPIRTRAGRAVPSAAPVGATDDLAPAGEPG
jgi:hypothetical protein